MKKLMVFALLGLVIAPAAMAVVPNQMNVQGRLLNAGSPMTGSHPAVFAIYAAATGGAALWTENSSLTVQGGIFSAILGQAAPIPTIVFDNQSRWLQVTVDGSTLAPRLQLATSAYAFSSQRADTANFALNAASAGDNLWETDNTNVWRSTGRVGIGVSSPASVLDISSTTGDHNVNSIHYSATNPTLKLDALAGGNQQSAVQFLKNGASKWSLLNDVLGNDSQNIGFKNLASGTVPFVIDESGRVGFGNSNPQARLDINTDSGHEIRFSGSGVSNIYGANEDFYIDAAPGWSLVLGADGISNQFTLGHRVATMEGDFVLNSGGDAKIYTGWGAGDQDRYLQLLNSKLSENASGLKAGGILVADTYAYANPGPNDLIVKGNVAVGGALTVTGTKCREVSDPVHGKLYFNAVESGHALFTDDGDGHLIDGMCSIDLDQRWLAGVTVDDTHPLRVWITFTNDPGGAHHVRKRADGFDVIGPSGSNAQFDWKVEARQRGYEDLYLNQPVHTAASRGGR